MPFLDINGASLHVHSTGKGIPIVFIHPPLLTSETFNYQKAQLSDEFQVITFDVRGHGESKPTESKITYSLLAEDIRQLLDAHGIDKAYLCGYSTGGGVVLEALLTYSDRFLGAIIVSGMSEVKDFFNKGRIWLASQLTGTTGTRKLLAAAVSVGNADMKITYNNLYGSARKGKADNLHDYYQASLKYNATRRLPAIKQPVLLIYGEKDRSYHPYAHLLHDKLQNSSLYFIKDGKHQVIVKQANKVNDLIRLWVDSLQDQKTDRGQLDLDIARKLNPDMYMYNENGETLNPRH
jgi:pimeloyl-ACP methyl ester carboxylesterase